jgi:3-phosphoshikimate 1-carboxyvinyltransferase
VVTCLGLGIGCHLTGLHTLKIKETDRLEALRIELTKLEPIYRLLIIACPCATAEINRNVKNQHL